MLRCWKKLVVEFKDELDALGVKVDKLDGRVAVLEENLGGWKFWGEFRFDAKFADRAGGLYTDRSDVDFNLNRYRIWMSKKVDDKVKFTARLGNNAGNVSWQRYWIDVALPWDVNMMAGLWAFDWEDDDGLYTDNDAWFTDRSLNGFSTLADPSAWAISRCMLHVMTIKQHHQHHQQMNTMSTLAV